MAVEGSNKTCRVYVGNLDYKVSTDELLAAMKEVGDVVTADIIMGTNGRSRGYAIVEFASEETAKKAIEQLNDVELGTRKIFLREDREETKGISTENRPPRAKGSGKGKGKGMDWGYGGGKGYGGWDYWGKGKGKGAAPPLKVRPEDQGRLLYVGNLPFKTSWQDVKDAFREAGEVIRVDIPASADGRQRGFAQVLYEKAEDAQKAISMFNDTEFKGRTILVREDKFTAAGHGDTAETEEA